MRRFIRHFICDYWSVHSAFPAATLKAIEREVAVSEQGHAGELRFVVESALPLPMLVRGVSSRERAIQLFGHLRIWDTEQNSGVLIYVLLADRHVEIVADRGIHRRVGEAPWVEICKQMQHAFRQGQYEAGAVTGIRAVGALLQRHFPPGKDNPDELPNRPVLLS
jgi:uncharacterized membrane protein